MTGYRRKITAVVFDLRRGCLDWDPRHLCFKQLFASPAEMEDFLRPLILAPPTGITRTTWERHHAVMPPPRPAASPLPGHDHGVDGARREMIAYQIDETVGVLAELKAEACGAWPSATWSRMTFATRRARFTFMSWLDGHVISGIEGVARPDRRISRSCCAGTAGPGRDGVHRRRAVGNVAAARGLSLHALHYTFAGALRKPAALARPHRPDPPSNT